MRTLSVHDRAHTLYKKVLHAIQDHIALPLIQCDGILVVTSFV